MRRGGRAHGKSSYELEGFGVIGVSLFYHVLAPRDPFHNSNSWGKMFTSLYSESLQFIERISLCPCDVKLNSVGWRSLNQEWVTRITRGDVLEGILSPKFSTVKYLYQIFFGAIKIFTIFIKGKFF